MLTNDFIFNCEYMLKLDFGMELGDSNNPISWSKFPKYFQQIMELKVEIMFTQNYNYENVHTSKHNPSLYSQ